MTDDTTRQPPARDVNVLAAYKSFVAPIGNSHDIVFAAVRHGYDTGRAADAEEIEGLRADLALIQVPGALLPDAHDADWWRRTTAYWATRDEEHEAERDALAQRLAAAEATIAAADRATDSYNPREAGGWQTVVDRVQDVLSAYRPLASASPPTPESETNR